MADIQSREEAVRVADYIRNNPDMDSTTRQNMMDALRRYDSQPSAPAPAAGQPAQPEVAPEPEAPREFNDGKKVSVWQAGEALYDLGSMVATSAVAQPVSGIAGAAAMMYTALQGGDANAIADAGANWQQATERLLTNDPESALLADVTGEAVQGFTKLVGKSPEQLGIAFDDAMMSTTGGNPYMATALKTAIVGIPSVIGMGKGNLRPGKMTAARKADEAAQAAALKKVQDAGLTDVVMDLPDAVKGRLDDVVGHTAERGANFDDVLADLRTVRNQRKLEVDNAWESFRQSNAGFETKGLKDAAQRARAALIQDGLNPNSYPAVRDALGKMSRLSRKNLLTDKKIKGGRRQTASAVELDILRKEVSHKIKGNTSKGIPFTPEDKALLKVKKMLDSELEDQFIRGAMSGDPATWGAWKQAKGLSAAYARDFKTDSVISKMMLDGVSPEGAYRFLVGANAMNAGPQAIQTVRRLKEVLGPHHPSLQHIKTAALRDIMLPGLDDKNPNFMAVYKNTQKALQQQPALLKELDIDTNALRRLGRASRAAAEIRKSHPERFAPGFWNGIGASVFFGHSIARKGALVRTVRKSLNRVTGVGMVNEKHLRELLDIPEIRAPMVDVNRPALALWIAQSQAAAASDQE